MTLENEGTVYAKAPSDGDFEPVAKIGENGVYEALISYIEHIIPGIPIVTGLKNRVSLPLPPYIFLQFLGANRASTPQTRYTDTHKITKIFYLIKVRLFFYGGEIECKGENNKKKRIFYKAHDMAHVLSTLWNDSNAYDYFSELKIPLSPLYTDDINLSVFVGGEDQYADRFSIDLTLEYHSEVKTKQQSAKEIRMMVRPVNTK